MSDIQLEDSEETPQSKHRKKLAQEYHQLKAAKGIVSEWFTIDAGKLLKVKVSTAGNVHRVYVGSMTQKETKELAAKLKSEGMVKAVDYKP